MKNLFRQIGVVLLLGVFCIYMTPREYVHHLTGHEDTVDEPVCSTAYKGGLVLTPEHQHCAWVHWAVESFLPSHDVIIPSVPFFHNELLQELPVYTYSYPAYYFSLRAPPQA